MGSNEERLVLLLRKNHGNRLLQGLKEKILSQTSIKQITLTSLEQRDMLWKKFCFLLENEKSRYVYKIENQKNSLQIRKLFTQLSRPIDHFTCYMFLSHYQDIGGIKVDAVTFFENAFTLLEIDRDSVFVISDDLENGIMLDFYESDIGTGWTYEIVILGQKWIESFNPINIVDFEVL